MAKPNPFTEDIIQQILDAIASGETLTGTCRKMGLSHSSFLTMIQRDKPLYDRYVQARETQAEVWADRIIETSEDSSGDTIETERGPMENKEWVNRSKLKVETLKWLMGKNHIRRFGDKVQAEVTGKDGGPLVIKWEE